MGAGVQEFTDWTVDAGYGDAFDDILRDFFEICREVTGLQPSDALDAVGQPAYDSVIGTCLEWFASSNFEEAGYLADRFLEDEGGSLRAIEQEYLRALSRSCPSLYEVVDVVPKSHVVVRDFFQGGEPIRVPEVLGSQQLVQWQWIFARVLEVGGSPCFSGTSLRLDHREREHLEAFVRAAAKRALRDVPKMLRKSPGQSARAMRVALQASCPVAATLWLSDAVGRLERPTLAVTGGETICLTDLSYRLTEDPARVAESLSSADDFHETEAFAWNWMPDADEEGGIIHAFVKLAPGRLTTNTLSRSRADRFDERICGLLGPGIALEGRHESEIGPPDASVSSPDVKVEDPVDHEVKAAIIGEFMTKHYRKTLDEPIPMLGNRTPRELAKTPKGRQKVANWLKTLEAQTGEHAIPGGWIPFDFQPLWAELGVEDLRK